MQSRTILTNEELDSLDLATDNLPAVDTPDACDKAAISPDGGGSGNNVNKGNSNDQDDPRPPFMRQQTTGGSVKGPPPRQNTITRRRLRAPVWASRTAKYRHLF
uniref:CSON001902 protein n=1 Tax=Culicoides sonorensis TaxID=179676 RepID=A0A336LRE4_CULSO